MQRGFSRIRKRNSAPVAGSAVPSCRHGFICLRTASDWTARTTAIFKRNQLFHIMELHFLKKLVRSSRRGAVMVKKAPISAHIPGFSIRHVPSRCT